ncbi:uncharacterized protein LOC135337261 [Halichondria panicea]|uniref:uncharacterized protein LOC135337261 n=1 Tax=Halichondria panicea TaxID=6063 RepID=UPI00312BAB28
MQHIHNMEIQSDGARTSIQDATEILHNTSVWEFYRSVVATASHGGAGVMDQRTLDSATYLLAHAVMVNSTQRSGAVISMTVDEFENANKETCLEGDVWVVRSHKHKTQAQGSATLIFTANLYKYTKDYQQFIRPHQLGTKETHTFFLTHGGKEMDHMARKEKVEAKKHNFQFVNSTEMRKAVATEATKHLDPEQRNIIAQQMSHSRYTEDLHYNKDIHTTKSAVEAYQLVKAAGEASGEASNTPAPAPPSRKTNKTKTTQKRRSFTARETKLVEDCFSQRIQKGQTLSFNKTQ